MGEADCSKGCPSKGSEGRGIKADPLALQVTVSKRSKLLPDVQEN